MMRLLVIHVLARLAIAASCTNSAAALEAPVKPTDPACISEQMMSSSLETARPGAIRDSLQRWSVRLVSRDGRAVGVEELPVTSRSAMTAPQATRALFWSVLEGFAWYGASLHGIVTVDDVARASGTEPPPAAPWRERPTSIVLAPTPVVHQISIAGEADAETRPGWLTAARRGIASRWAYWRREREISQAVAAFNQFDDRTLRDMGIPNRTLIEKMLRYGRDC